MDTKIVADEGLLARVRAATAPAELCDASGNTVAMVVPTDLFADMFLAWADEGLTPDMIAENRKAVAEGRVMTTAEVLAHLDSLDRQPGGQQ